MPESRFRHPRDCQDSQEQKDEDVGRNGEIEVHQAVEEQPGIGDWRAREDVDWRSLLAFEPLLRIKDLPAFGRIAKLGPTIRDYQIR